MIRGYHRSMRALGIVFAAGVCAAMGCTAILGDFSIASGPATGDGGADSPAPKQLICAVDSQRPPQEVAQIIVNGGGLNSRVFYSAADAKTTRLLYDDNIGNVAALTFDSNGGSLQTITEPGRLFTATQTSNGIVAVIQDNMSRDLAVRTLPNGANSWNPVRLEDQLGKPGEFQTACVRDVSLLVTDNETVVLVTTATDMNCQNASALKAFRTKPSIEAQWDISALGGASLGDAIMVVDSINVFAFVSQGGGNSGPQAGTSPFLFTAKRADLVPQGPPIKLPLVHPKSDIAAVGAVVNSQEIGKAELMMIAGDITSGNGEIAMFVGKRTLQTLSTLTPQQDLPKIVVPSLSQLPVSNGEIRWHQSPGRQDLLAVSTILPNPTPSPGINFWWFDDKGNVLARQAGPTDALLKQEPSILAISVDFLSPPAILATIGVAYEIPAKNGAKDTYSVMVGRILCGSGN